MPEVLVLLRFLSSAEFPAKFQGLLEHLPHFVRAVHDIGSVLIRHSRHVAVDYPHQPVGLLSHCVALAKTLLVGLIACRRLSAEDFPRLVVNVLSSHVVICLEIHLSSAVGS